MRPCGLREAEVVDDELLGLHTIEGNRRPVLEGDLGTVVAIREDPGGDKRLVIRKDVLREFDDILAVSAGLEVRHHIPAAAGRENEGIRTTATGQHIVARPADQRVIARSAVQLVVASTAVKNIIAGAAHQHVVTGAALDDVVAVTSNHTVVASARIHHVVAGTGQQRVVAVTTRQHVFSITARAPDDPRLYGVKFLSMRLGLCVPVFHTLAARESVFVAELEGLSFVMRERGSRTREIFEKNLADHGISIQPVIEISSREGVREAIANGVGCGVVADLEFGHDARLSFVPLCDATELIDEYAICLAERRHLPLVRRFIEEAGRVL